MDSTYGPPCKSIFIKNLPFNARETDLRPVFTKFGRVRDIYVPLDFYTKVP